MNSIKHTIKPSSINPTRLAIIGFGLIGSSIAKAIRQRELNESKIYFDITVYDLANTQTQTKLRKIKHSNLIDKIGKQDFSDLSKADLIVISTPVGKMLEVFEKIKSYANPNCVITDSGSTKTSVVNDAKKVFNQIPSNFVPAHPLAGSEISGLNTGFADLFKQKLCLICKSENTSENAIARVSSFWSFLGAKIENLDLSIHDNLLAHTSHLPHLLSYCLVNVLLDCNDSILDFASSGFAGISRLASSDPDLWFDILSNNKDEIDKALNNLQIDLSKAREALINDDKEFLVQYFLRAKIARDKHIKKHPEIFK